MQKPDILYIVKNDDDNEELRYSLRSLRNLPHGKVFISGYTPKWVDTDNVISIDSYQGNGVYGFLNARSNLQHAMMTEKLSEDFVLMNDDFFIMKPIKSVPNLYGGMFIDMIDALAALNSKTTYLLGARASAALLNETGLTISDIKNYSIHTPMLMNKMLLYEVLMTSYSSNHAKMHLHIRTLYGNTHDIGGAEIKDIKVTGVTKEAFEGKMFLSTTDNSFKNGAVGTYVRNQLYGKGEYEL